MKKISLVPVLVMLFSLNVNASTLDRVNEKVLYTTYEVNQVSCMKSYMSRTSFGGGTNQSRMQEVSVIYDGFTKVDGRLS